MVQGISGGYGVYGTRAYAAYRGYSVGYTARMAGLAGGSVDQVGPISRAARTTAPVMIQTAAKESTVPAQAMAAGAAGAAATDAQAQPVAFFIPDAADNKYTAAELAVRSRIRPFEDPAAMVQNKAGGPEQTIKADGMDQLNEDTECQTCKERKYQDQSGDASVSFQNPQTIDPAVVASTVRGHEMEHVYHEQAKAAREGRKVVSQSVTLHTAICPDCGETYISGGTTKTVTMADNGQTALEQQAEREDKEPEEDPFLANMRLPA